MKTSQIGNIRPLRFNDRVAAFTLAYSLSLKPMRVMLGDDGCYWIVSLADAARLERAGFKPAH